MDILNLEKKASIKTEYEFPIIYYEENMYFKKDKSSWAVYKLEGYTYNFRGYGAKLSKLNDLTRLLWNLKLEGQVRAIPVVTSIREVNDRMKKRAIGPLKVQVIQELEAQTNDLVQFIGDEGNEYDWYLIVKLDKPNHFFSNMKEFIQSVYQDPIRKLNEIAGLDNPEIFLREIGAFKNFEELIFQRINKHEKASRTDEYEIQKLIKQLFYFGIGEPEMRGERPSYDRFRTDKSKTWKPAAEIITRNGEKVIRPHTRDIMTLTEAEINIKPMRHLEITQFYKGREVTTYQAYIVVADIPDLHFPGNEWLYSLLTETRFPINVSIRFKVKEYKDAIGEVRKKQKDIADQDEHIRGSNNAVPLDVMESSEEAVVMEHDLKNRKFPLLYTTIIIGVNANDKEELNKRVESIRTHFDDIRTEVPAGDQWMLFNEMMIGGEQYATDYILRLTPEALAGSMFGAIDRLGDEEGVYIGLTGVLRKPVRIDLWKPALVNRAPNIAVCGSQGGGKSFTADLLACTAAKLGAKVLAIDPKGDRTNWPADLRSFGNEVKVTTFTAKEKDKGKLDPFNILKTGMTKEDYKERMLEAANLALDICMFLIAADRKDPRSRLLIQSVDRVVNSPKVTPAMNRIIDEFRTMAKEAENDGDPIKKSHCSEIADTLHSYKNMAYASLLFGDGDEDAVNLESAINVLQIQNLTFPKEGTLPEEYTYQEIIGYACLLAISGFIMRFIMGDRNILKVFEMDEATVMRSTPTGRNLVNKIQRMARAMFSPGIFISQNVDDFGDEKVRNNIGYKFAFKSTDEVEIRKVLDFYNLEHTKENIETIKNLGNGVTLFQDLEGRTGVVAIDAVFEEYIKAFNTTPESKKEEDDEEITITA